MRRELKIEGNLIEVMIVENTLAISDSVVESREEN